MTDLTPSQFLGCLAILVFAFAVRVVAKYAGKLPPIEHTPERPALPPDFRPSPKAQAVGDRLAGRALHPEAAERIELRARVTYSATALRRMRAEARLLHAHDAEEAGHREAQGARDAG